MSQLFGPKLSKIQNGYLFFCPGCEIEHLVYVTAPDKPNWQFNNNPDAPTFSPSIDVRYPWGPSREERHCHSFVTDGKIQFLGDCTHALKGQTVEIPNWTDS